MALVRRLVHCRRGASMVEYAVLLGMIAMVCLVIIASLGSSVKNTFSQFSCGGLHGDAFRDCSGTSPGNSGH